MKHHCKLLFSIVFFIPFLSSAQSNFKPGYVVVLNGDTLKGYVDQKEWDTNPGQITFKKELNSANKEVYTTKTAEAFAVNGLEYYKRAMVKISQNRVEVTNLIRGVIDTTAVNASVFLRTLATGKNIVLFEYKDAAKARYYVTEGNTAPTELLYGMYLERGDEIVYDRAYRRQLQGITATYRPNDIKLVNLIQRSRYSQDDLVKVADQLNGTAAKSAKNVSGTRGGARLFAGIGTNREQLNFEKGSVFQSSSSSASFGPMISFGADFFINKEVGKLILRNELILTSNKITSNYSGFLYATFFTYRQTVIAFNPHFLYNLYNATNTKIYLAAGASVKYAMYNNQEYYTTSAALPTTRQYNSFPLFQTLYITPGVKAGAVLSNKIDLQAAFNFGGAVNNNASENIKVSSLQLGLKYLFHTK